MKWNTNNKKAERQKNLFPLAGTVVIYNPKPVVVDNIASYAAFLDHLFVMDNSEVADPEVGSLLERFPNITYIIMGGNLGVAAALNRSANLSIENGYSWLMMMDQDSSFKKNILPDFFNCLNKYDSNRCGIISAGYSRKTRYVEVPGQRYSELLVTITSGSFLNLQVFKKLGPFMEKLFIDHVDHEYCLRLKIHGYRIIRMNHVFIRHQLGNKKKYLFWTSSNHSPFRRYFMTRNRFFVARLYKEQVPVFFRTEILRFIYETVKMIVFEPEKFKKIRNTLLGYLDFRKNNFNRDLNEL